MTAAMRFAVGAVGCFILIICAVGLDGQIAPQVPVFRGGVNLVPLDVLVLDRDRVPVRGLKPEHFTIFEDGKPQRIVAFTEITSDPVTSTAPWMREIGPDVTANDLSTRRLVMIVLDDGGSGADLGEPRLATAVAQSIVDELGPNDLAAVIFTYMGRPQNFTRDRAQLRAAIESFRPHYFPNPSVDGKPLGCTLRLAGCAVNAFLKITEALRSAPPGRKMLLYIGPGISINLSMSNPDAPALLPSINEMFQDLQRQNISVYTFDPRGVMTNSVVTAADSSLLALAESTGGRFIANTNAPWQHVPAVFRENSSYYLLGYVSTNPSMDGRFRRIHAAVNLPHVELRTRSGYYGPGASGPVRVAPPPLDVALARGLPSGELPMVVTTAAFAVPGRRQAELVLAVAVRDRLGTATSEADKIRVTHPVTLVATAFDAGWARRGAHRQTLELGLKPGPEQHVEYELLSRLSLEPGRYEVRVGAESGSLSGSVFVTVDVPDFSRAALSASGVLLERTPASLHFLGTDLGDLVPVRPTTVRAFERSDRVTAFMRLYQGGRGALIPVQLSTRVVDSTNQTVTSEHTRLEANHFDRNRSMDYRWTLPFPALPPGEYVLTTEATAGSHRVRRDVRFTRR